MMIILIAVLVIGLGVVGLMFFDDWEHEGLHFTSMVFTFIGGGALAIMLLIAAINQLGGRGEVERYHAIKETIEISRSENISEIERAALTKEIIEVNAHLASAKYWNENGFDIFIYDGVTELEPLK